MSIRTYSELIQLPTLEERFLYLKLNGHVAQETFGFDRYLNQKFYRDSYEWQHTRNIVIDRDNGCELGMEDFPIKGNIFVHHMNPIRLEDIYNRNSDIWNPEYLICCSKALHDAIHYGDISALPKQYEPRRPNDTCPWKRGVK